MTIVEAKELNSKAWIAQLAQQQPSFDAAAHMAGGIAQGNALQYGGLAAPS